MHSGDYSKRIIVYAGERGIEEKIAFGVVIQVKVSKFVDYLFQSCPEASNFITTRRCVPLVILHLHNMCKV